MNSTFFVFCGLLNDDVHHLNNKNPLMTPEANMNFDFSYGKFESEEAQRLLCRIPPSLVLSTPLGKWQDSDGNIFIGLGGQGGSPEAQGMPPDGYVAFLPEGEVFVEARRSIGKPPQVSVSSLRIPHAAAHKTNAVEALLRAALAAFWHRLYPSINKDEWIRAIDFSNTEVSFY